MIAAGPSQRKSFLSIIHLVFGRASHGIDDFLSLVLAGKRTPASSMKFDKPQARKSYKMTNTTFSPAFEGSILVSYMLQWFLVRDIVANLFFTQLLSWVLIFTPVLALCNETSSGHNQDMLVRPLSTTPRIVLVMQFVPMVEMYACDE